MSGHYRDGLPCGCFLESGADDYLTRPLEEAHTCPHPRDGSRRVQRAFAGAGTSFRERLCRVRMEQAADLLRDGSTVAAAFRSSGYRCRAHFAKAFRRHYGCPPVAFRGRRGQ